jgi:hypothetical protein
VSLSQAIASTHVIDERASIYAAWASALVSRSLRE